MNEKQVRVALAKYLTEKYPLLLWRFDLSSDLRVSPHIAKQLAKQNRVKSLPDLGIFRPIGSYAGLFLELKSDERRIIRADGKLYASQHLQNQGEKIRQLRIDGYAADFGIGLAASTDIIDSYLKGKYKVFWEGK